MPADRKFCNNCGAPNNPDLRFCTSCGARFESGTPPAQPGHADGLPLPSGKKQYPEPPKTLFALGEMIFRGMRNNIRGTARGVITGMIIAFTIVLLLNTFLQVTNLSQSDSVKAIIPVSGAGPASDALLFWFLFTAILAFFWSQIVSRGVRSTIDKCVSTPRWILDSAKTTGTTAFPLIMAGVAVALMLRLFLLSSITGIQFLILMFGILYSQQESLAVLAMCLGYSDIHRIIRKSGPAVPAPGFPVMGVCGALFGFLITVFVASSLLIIGIVVFLMVAGSVAILYRRRTSLRILTAILVSLLLFGVMAAAADCPAGCSCVTKDEARIKGYDPCNGKLTLCGYDQFQTAKYCYAVPYPAGTPSVTAMGKPPIPYGWYTYHTTGHVPTDEGTTITVDSTLRYDITQETFRGQAATRIRMDMRTTASTLGTARVSVDMYQDPVTSAVLGGTATATQGGKTQSVDLSRIPELTASGSGVTYTQPGELSTKNFESSLKTVAAQSGGRFTKATEPLSIPAGTFPVTTRYTLTVPDEEGTATMYIWISDSVPVVLKTQGKDPGGREIMKMELTGYGVTGAASPGGILGGILPSGSSSMDPGDSGEDLEDIGTLLFQSLGLGALGAGFNSVSPLPVNWNEVPAAMSGSMIPATLGAFGALLGGSVGALILFPAGFSWPGRAEGSEGADDEGTTRTATDVVEQGGLTPLELAAAGAGADRPIDRLAAPPLWESDDEQFPDLETGSENDDTEPDSNEYAEPDSDEPDSDEYAEPEPVDPDTAGSTEELFSTELAELQNIKNDAEEFIESLQNDPEVQLAQGMQTIVGQKIDEGFVVQNPFLVNPNSYATTKASTNLHWAGVKTVNAITNTVYGPVLDATTVDKYGQCGEFAYWGRDWSREMVKNAHGNGTYIDIITINGQAWDNHAATRFVTPSGERYVLDYWEAVQKGKDTFEVSTEAEWTKKWRDKLKVPDAPLRYGLEYEDFEKNLMEHGETKGIELFRKTSPLSPEEIKTIVNDYHKNPWFKPTGP